jgi:hypothetical protein
MLPRRLAIPENPAGTISRPHPARPFCGLRSGISAPHHADARGGEPQNEHDGVLMSVRDPAARARLIVPLQPAAEPGALAGTFDIVLG